VNDIKLTILYVEDEESIQSATKRPLSRLCDTLILASDGKEGLELYKQHKPDIVISDIKMPTMTGVEMCKAIKEINPKQHFIFTTAHSESGYFMDAIELQVDGYILKPVNYKLLKSKVIDITEHIQLKHKYEEQRELTEEITQLQDNLLFVLNKDKKVIFSNPKFLQFFHVKDTSEFNETFKNVADIFIKNNDFFYPKENRNWIEDLKQEKNEKRRIVSLLNKDMELHTFLISIKCTGNTKHCILTLTEVTNLTVEKDIFEKRAYTDELTQIPNRAFFEEIFTQEIARHQRDNAPSCLIILDIDKFKDFNDTYGHDVGDEILVGLAKIIQLNTRATDTFARWGGEEFTQILPNTSLDNAKKVAQHLRQKIEEHTFKDGLKVTCSFGISEFKVDDTKKTVIRRADKALYRAKENGRNKVEV